MKSLKLPLIIAAAAVFLSVALGLLIATINTKNQDEQGAQEEQDEPQEVVAVWDTTLVQANLPVLNIDGKKNPDVYLQSLDIQVEVTGNIASTRYTMVFKNRTDRTLEGELTFPLPDGRTITHYALDINGKMRDAVPVEKARATEVFEEIEQRPVVVDPSLLERVEGNNFRTRIYPIPARGKRTISIGYEEELTLEKGLMYYRLPMAYADSIEKFAVKASVWNSKQKPLIPEFGNELSFDVSGENYVASFVRENYRPSQALNFALPVPTNIPQVIMQPAQGSHYFFASVAPRMQKQKKQWNGDLAIIWDVSLSGSQRNLQREIEMLDIIFSEKKDAKATLYFLNNTFKKITKGNWADLKSILEKAVYDGGTDFSKINLKEIEGDEILFFSDGISTLSDADFIGDTKVSSPVHCIVSSPKSDYSAMRLIAGKTKGKFINVNALSPERLKDELLNETLLFLGVEHGKSVREVYPSIATPVHGNFSIAGISETNDEEITLLFGFGNKVEKKIKVKLDAKNANSKGNVYRIWAQKKIAELDLNYEKNRTELTELGQQFGIVTRNTSLIVLETLSDYIQYGIEPPATEPQMRAEYKRWANRTKIVQWDAVLPSSRRASAYKRTRDNAAGIQTSGKNELGGRRGAAAGGFNDGYAEGGSGGIGDMLGGLMGGSAGGLGSKAKGSLKAPSARNIEITGDGSRSKAEIMAVVNARMPGLRNIYNKYLKLKPEFGGKITLKFSIAPSGDIDNIDIVSSTTGYSDFDNAVKNMVATWKWKFIKSGRVTSIVPFTFDDFGKGSVPQETQPVAQSSQSEPSSQSAQPPPARSSQSTQPPPPSRRIDGSMLDEAVFVAGNIKKWWNTDFTSSTPQKSKYPMPDGGALDMSEKIEKVEIDNFVKDSEYLSKLTGKTEEDYQIYLKLRNDYANSPKFYFDMANWFYKLGNKEIALRVLTSIADLELENSSLYRLLGYRFKEYGEYALEKFVCQKVVQWRPMEPQSYRDYALALADNGEEQAALDSLYSLLTRQYSKNITRRSRGVAEAVLMEINRLISKNSKLNTSKIDKQLIMNIPVDVRVVINWNMNNTDIDLYVKDPNGEECYYGNNKTKIGGRLSITNTGGYGPEQFILKKAIKGKYKIYVGYYGDRQFIDAGPSTVMAEVYTKYAGKTEKRQVVSLQMSNAKKIERGNKAKVQVAEFEF